MIHIGLDSWAVDSDMDLYLAEFAGVANGEVHNSAKCRLFFQVERNRVIFLSAEKLATSGVEYLLLMKKFGKVL